jgi:lipopolysaccharide transport system ATP-binding protein
MPPAIRLSRVTKRYRLGVSRTSLPAAMSKWMKLLLHARLRKQVQNGYHWALKDVSFELGRGESLALIGPNGAGKSTILKLLSKITFPTSGSIQINGQISALIELGAGFHPDLTGRENVYLNAAILGFKRHEIGRRFDEIVAFSELERFVDTPLKRYSSGMTVRLGFAVASCMDPDILLVDEVLAVGDASFRLKCIERIKQLHQQGTSMIFVSHDLGLVKAICQTAILLEGGIIQAQGSPSEIIAKYNEALDARRNMKLAQASTSGDKKDGDVEITKVEAMPADTEPSNPIRSDGALEIRMSYIAYRAMDSACALVRIYRNDGVSCCVMRTADDGFDLSIQPGKGSISVFLDPLQLSGGSYHAIAWILDADGINGLTRGASDWFQVHDVLPGREAYGGIFEPRRRWADQHCGFGDDIGGRPD